MFSRLASAVGWRSRILGAKAGGLMKMVPWPVVWSEISRRRELKWDSAGFAPTDEGPVDGLQQMAAGEERYWVPAGTYAGGLDAIYKEVFNPDHPHHYEHAGCRIQRDDVVIDGGACEGFFTRFALQKGARVIAVEPYSVMADALRRTFAREIESGQVVVRQVLLSDRNGIGNLGLNPLFPFEAHSDTDGSSEFSEPVPETTIDQLIAETGWGRCDFIKMDIEGLERAAVAGAMATIRAHHPSLSIAVYHEPSGYCDIAADLMRSGLGYSVVGKGITQLRDTIWRPMMLHAWMPQSQTGQNGRVTS